LRSSVCDVSAPVVVLAGGTGGAKLARGMLDVVGPDELVVIANTADDIEIYGAYVCPDPDLVAFTLADRIDERGWGLAGDTFNVMQGLRDLGIDVWFNLGDRDLAIGIERARALQRGRRLTDALANLTTQLGLTARVLPMSDQPVRTRVMAAGRWHPFQEFMIRSRGGGPVQDVDFRGARAATATPEVLEAIATARAIVIGPSNPIISIGPMLAIGAFRAGLEQRACSLVAVSPLHRGAVLKGPTAAFMAWAGHPLSSDGIAAAYSGLLDGLVADESASDLPTHRTDVLMDTAGRRRRLAEETLQFALSFASRPE
jgi:LPPG:FO 2-phospho-L-lactate transferase